LLGNLVGERPKPGALAADENDGVHQPAVVVVVLAVVVVVLLGVVVEEVPEAFVVVVVVPGLIVVVVTVVVVVWDLMKAATRWAAGGLGTEAPFAT
jgi:hypothetical protein